MASQKYKKILKDHEQTLLDEGRLQDHTHPSARSVILLGDSLEHDGSKLFDLLIASTMKKISSSSASKTNISKESFKLVSKFRQKYEGVSFNANKLFKLRPDFFQHVVEEQKKAISSPSSSVKTNPFFTTVYRPVGDDELRHLQQANQLPSTQPYQAIMEGQPGRAYAERYVDGTKRVDTAPATVIEIVAPTVLIQKLFEKQQKPEDGCLSHGLGFAAGKDLDVMNSWLKDFNDCFVKDEDYDYDASGDDDDDEDETDDDKITAEEDVFCYQRAWRIVKVKRRIP